MIYLAILFFTTTAILGVLLVRERLSKEYWLSRYTYITGLKTGYELEIEHLKKELEQFKNAELILANSPELEDQEQGNFVRRKSYKRATPETYRNLFDLDADGQRVLEHLTTVFCRDAFASTDRETNYRLGQHSVINFIINNINQANHPNYKEEVND